MKIAIDSGPLRSGHRVRGIGAHTRELLWALQEIKNKENIKIVPLDFSTQNSKLKTQNFDVIHYSSFSPFFISLPFNKPKAKVVLTIHDLIPLIYPKYYPGGLRGEIRFLINKFLIKRNVDAIITISETSKKDICRFLEISPDKVHVVYLAPRKIFKKLEIKKRYGLPERFVLYVGDINYNKNILNLIKACKIAKIPLIICGKQALDIEERGIDLNTLQGPMDYVRYLFGKPHPELAHFEQLSREFKNSKVIRLGYVSDEDLVKIYNLASVYVQPSFYEGFGLPVLEAFACGCPIVASKTQALVEIAEGAARFVDPNRPEDIARGIKNPLPTSVQAKLPRRYSWEKTAKETLKIYAKI